MWRDWPAGHADGGLLKPLNMRYDVCDLWWLLFTWKMKGKKITGFCKWNGKFVCGLYKWKKWERECGREMVGFRCLFRFRVCVSFVCFGYDDSFIDKRSSRQSCSGSFWGPRCDCHQNREESATTERPEHSKALALPDDRRWRERCSE